MPKLHIFLIALFSLFFFNCNVYAVEYGGIGGKPAYPRSDNSRSESIFIHTASTGQTIKEGILMINNKPETKTLMVYATDSTPSTDGGFACEQFSEEKDGVGSWINLEKQEITLKSNTSEIINFTINIPENAGVGEHNGCIVIQEKKSQTNNKSGINLSLRTGLRVALTVPGDIIRKLTILNFQLTKTGPRVFTLIPEVKNFGNVSLDTNINVVVKNSLTKKIINNYGGVYPILRDDTSRWNYQFEPSIWGGRYKASLEVTYNDGNKDIILTGQDIYFFALPTPKAILFIILGLLPFIIFFIWLISIRIIAIRRKRTWQDYQVKSKDTIQSIAGKTHTTWKKIAKFNKLKAPYALKKDQIIKTPPQK